MNDRRAQFWGIVVLIAIAAVAAMHAGGWL